MGRGNQATSAPASVVGVADVGRLKAAVHAGRRFRSAVGAPAAVIGCGV
jgi:hypothetical protein